MKERVFLLTLLALALSAAPGGEAGAQPGPPTKVIVAGVDIEGHVFVGTTTIEAVSRVELSLLFDRPGIKRISTTRQDIWIFYDSITVLASYEAGFGWGPFANYIILAIPESVEEREGCEAAD